MDTIALTDIGATVVDVAHQIHARNQGAKYARPRARVRRLALPHGKDVTDFVVAGGDLRMLVGEALR